MRSVAGAATLRQHLLVRAVADSSQLRRHAAIHVITGCRRRAFRNDTWQGLVDRVVCGFGRCLLARSGAVRGLGRDRDCGKYSGHCGDILFIAVRQKIHAETLSMTLERTDGAFHHQQPIATRNP